MVTIKFKYLTIKTITPAFAFMQEDHHVPHCQVLELEDTKILVNFILTATENPMCSCGSEPETTA